MKKEEAKKLIEKMKEYCEVQYLDSGAWIQEGVIELVLMENLK